jgi:precorrin-3B methylase
VKVDGAEGPPGVLAVGAAVKIIAADDEHMGQIGTVQTLFDDADDGLDVGVIFKGDTGIYAFGRNELRVTTPG